MLRPEKVADNDTIQDQEDATGSAPAVLLKLRGSAGRPGLASMQDELAKLELIRQIGLPATLFDHAAPRDLERCRQRVSVEMPRDYAALTPLIWEHVNPYGRCDLDMNVRLTFR